MKEMMALVSFTFAMASICCVYLAHDRINDLNETVITLQKEVKLIREEVEDLAEDKCSKLVAMDYDISGYTYSLENGCEPIYDFD